MIKVLLAGYRPARSRPIRGLPPKHSHQESARCRRIERELVGHVTLAGVESERATLPSVSATHNLGVAILSRVPEAVGARSRSARYVRSHRRKGQRSPPGRFG